MQGLFDIFRLFNISYIMFIFRTTIVADLCDRFYLEITKCTN